MAGTGSAEHLDEPSSVGGVQSARVADDDDPPVDEERRRRAGVDDGPDIEVVGGRPAVLLDDEGGVPVAEQLIDERPGGLGDERGVVAPDEVGRRGVGPRLAPASLPPP